MEKAVHNLVVGSAILAGGQARRMGGLPKGNLCCSGTASLVERLLRQIEFAGIPETVIVANEPHAYTYLSRTIIPDTRENMGPIAGIEAALGHFDGTCDAVLILPCDLPEISSDEISALVDAFQASEAPVVFAETADGCRHPLCAVVATSLRASVSTTINTGLLRVGTLWTRLGGIGIVSDNIEAFTNLNSVADVNRWREMKGQGSVSSRSSGLDQRHVSADRGL